MMLYRLRAKDAFGAAETTEGWRFDLFKPEPVDGWKPLPNTYDGARLPDILWNQVGWILFSAEAREVLEPFCEPGTVQWFEVEVKGKTETKKYWLLNIFGARASWKRDGSEDDDSFVEHVVDAASVSKFHVFRIEETRSVVLDVVAKKALDKRKLTGFKYLEHPAR